MYIHMQRIFERTKEGSESFADFGGRYFPPPPSPDKNGNGSATGAYESGKRTAATAEEEVSLLSFPLRTYCTLFVATPHGDQRAQLEKAIVVISM